MGKSFNTGKLVNNLNVLDNGNVGIGTSSFSPWAAGTLVLRVQQTSGLSVIQAVSGDGGSGICLYSGASSSDNPAIISLKDIRFGTATDLGTGGFNERMRITSSGNVGIGTGSPNGTLEVYAATPTIVSGASTSGSLHGYEFRQSNTLDAYIKQLPSTGELRFYVGRNSSWGGNMSFWTDTVNRMSISSSGTLSINGPRFIQQGLSRLCYAGSIGGNQSITITLNVGSQSAVKITAAMNHYGYISGYGCARMSWVGASPAFSEINISNVTSESGGSWSFTHGGGGVINIIKNAGSYGGGGYFFVEVIGNDPISIA
jgi:hypothetical protein